MHSPKGPMMQKIESFAFGQKIKVDGLGFLMLLRPHFWSLIFGCWLIMLSSLIMVLMPVLINGGVSLIENEQPFFLNLLFTKLSFANVYHIIIAVVVLAVIGAIIRTASRMVIFGIGRSVERRVRSELFSQLSVLDDRFYSKHSVGDLMNHLTTDVVNIRLVTGFASLNIMNIVFVFCLTVPFLLKVNTILAICALLPFPMVMMATGSISRKMFLATTEYQAQLGQLTDHVQENLLGAHVVRLFHQQAAENDRFLLTNQETYRLGVKLSQVRVLMMPVMRLVVGLAIALVLYVGGSQVLTGQITLGQFVEVNARILQLAWPAMSVGFVMSIYSRGKASLLRVNKLLSYSPTIKDGDHELLGIKKIDVQVNIRENAISFSLVSGQLLGIVGPSGSHKTHLLKMLCRRTWVPNGSVFYDDHDINNLKLQSLYEQVSIVSQESFLFHKSIRDNICFAKSATVEELNEVLRITRLDQDLLSFPQGLDTIVGERGITLSGGQRQRVALARALIAKKPMLILDDALSSVDAHTEEHIVSSLAEYLKKTIVIMATHRFFVLEKADEILVMDQGQVVGRGTHNELLKENSLYQQLWGLELKGLS